MGLVSRSSSESSRADPQRADPQRADGPRSGPSGSGRGRTGRPPRTSRAEILAGAHRILERDGWEKLTLRRLATEVGVGTMTLYHHVRDREDLLVQLINERFDRLTRPELPADPRERIVAAGVAAHDTLAAWPWAAEVLTTDGFLARVGDSALWLVEAIVAGAVDHGCTPEQAVHVFRCVWYYTVGEILVRARSDGRVSRRDDLFSGPDPALSSHVDPDRHPRLSAIGDRWPELAARDTYAAGLRALVDGLLARAGSG